MRINRFVWLLVFLLSVPIVGVGTAKGLQTHLGTQLRSNARLQPRLSDRLRLERLTLPILCESPGPQATALCETNARLNTLGAAASAVGVAGLGWVGLISLAGLLARRNRVLLLRVFQPGLYLTAVTVTGLILVHALILISSIYFLEQLLFNRVHFGVMIAVALGAASGVISVARNTFTLVKKAETSVIGRTVSRQDAPMLWHAVEGTALRLGALAPHHVVVGLEPNFFVTEADVVTLNETLSGRTLFCSLSFARILTKDEFVGVIGHELGHFRGEDTKFSERFYPIYRGTAASIDSLENTIGGFWGQVAVLPAIAVLGYFLEAFAVAETGLGRDRELAADAAGASVSGAHIMASALVKAHAFGDMWDQVCETAIESVTRGQRLPNISKTYSDLVVRRAPVMSFEGITDMHLSHPTDSHPSLSARLDAFDVSLTTVTPAALVVAPSDAAGLLLPDLEQREREITAAYQEGLAQYLREHSERVHAYAD